MLFLVEQNRALKRNLAARSQGGAELEIVQVGNVLAPIALTSLGEDTGRLDTVVESGVTVLAFFTTTCKFCEATLPVWTETSNRLGEMGIGFLARSP